MRRNNLRLRAVCAACAAARGTRAAAPALAFQYASVAPDGTITWYASAWYIGLCAAGIAGVYVYLAILAVRACRDKLDSV